MSWPTAVLETINVVTYWRVQFQKINVNKHGTVILHNNLGPADRIMNTFNSRLVEAFLARYFHIG